MRCIGITLTVLAFGTGLLAAWFWYRVSKVEIVPIWAVAGRMEPVIPELSQGGWISGLLAAGNEAARLNKIAALWTAASVAIGAAGNVAASWPR
jgi:hypothetical protein